MTIPTNVLDTDKTTLYARLVSSGEVIACDKVIKACERHLHDLEHLNEYEWRPDLVKNVSKFLEVLPDVKSGQTMPLLLFQHFIVGSLYGWVHKGTNKRRFTKAYVSTSRKNGKSILVNGIAQYELMFGKSPERQREIYISSNAYKQARIIFEMATSQLNMLKKGSKYINRNIKTISTEIRYLKDESVIKALSNNPSSADGSNPSCIILDEFGEMPDTEMYERLKTGMSQQENPLTLIVSTAGSDLTNPMYAVEYQYITKLLNNDIQDDNYFVYCAELDDEQEMLDEKLWIKAMPLLEHKTKREIILNNIKQDIKEQTEKGELTAVKIKYFNLWQNNMDNEEILVTDENWMSNKIDKPNIKGTDVYIGIDLSRQDDLSAVGMVHPIENYLWIDSHSFVPYKTTIEDKMYKDKINYLMHVKEGVASITDNSTGIIDYRQIVEFIKSYVKDNELNLKGIYFDRAYGEIFIERMQELYPEAKLIEVMQTVTGLGSTIKQFKYDNISGKVKHSDNALLTRAIRNARVKTFNDNMRIIKEKNRNKIDPLMAVLDGYTDAQFHEFAKPTLQEQIDKGEFSF